jgi:hypothetical protein
LEDGLRTLRVRASDAAGNVGEATRSWTVDTGPPDTAIGAGPSGLTNDSTPTFSYTSTESGNGFTCSVDGGASAPCDGGSFTAAALGDGPHSFSVWARDAVGNDDPSPATRVFTVDSKSPAVSLQKAPKKVVKTKKRKVRVEFEFDAGESPDFACQLDGAAPVPCTSPWSRKVKKGKHEFTVTATDGAGNRSAPVTHKFKVKRKR